MENKQTPPLCPLVTYTTQALDAYDTIILRPYYLERMGQGPEQATPGPSLSLSLDMTRRLIADLQTTLQQLEKAHYQKPSVPQ
ncbi:hypothetical protein [Methylobacillus glycogenes]|uniref:hypothetical protein n=1 Tax=Methylobacillus glycogenes TaxID=406 RepID=UPI00046F9A65|nr:hypothetical protein [Methylobacillus glycogenes]